MLDPRNMWVVMAICAALYLVYAAAQPGSHDSTQPVAYLRITEGSGLRVTQITESECRATPGRLWAKSEKEVACLAYVAPQSQPPSSTAIVFFHGDFSKKNQTAAYMSASRLSYERRAQRIASTFNTPVYVIGRPGVMGSTGFHVIGGVREENQLMASALAELKQHYRINRVVLGGQSGGARLAAQLLVSGRTDIACAVMASGAYDLPRLKGGGRTATNIWGEPSKSLLIPLRSIDGVVVDGQRRLYVVGDPRDQRTPFPEQRQWANGLKQAGHHVVLLEAAGRGKENHGLSSLALHIAGMCAAGSTDRQIAELVRTQRTRSGSKGQQ